MRGRAEAPAPLPVALIFLGLGALVAGACSQDSVVLPSRDFDRPTDMTFACLGMAKHADGKTHPFGQPMGKCHPAGELDHPRETSKTIGDENDKNDATYRTYAFLPNVERGDLSVVDFSSCRSGDTTCWPPGASLVDLDDLSVGFGAAPLGELPEVVAASQDGCRVISANRGSCDLTLVNPAVLLREHGQKTADRPAPDGRSYSRTIVPLTASGRLVVAPGEVAFLPQQTMGHDGEENLCDPRPGPGMDKVEGTLASTVGAPPATAAAPAGWRAVVTFPSCDLIALLDLPSGIILDSMQVIPRSENDTVLPEYTFRHTGRNPMCPVSDCAGSQGGGQGGAPADGGGDTGTPSSDGDDDAGADAGDAASGTTSDAGDGGTGAAQTASALPPTSGLGVGPMAVHPEGRRVYFGANNFPILGALDITGAADTFAVPAQGASTELHDGARGAMRLRLSVDPFDYSKGHDAEDSTRAEYGRFVAGRHDEQPADPLEFLYAIAKDGTVRVIHVGRDVPAECDLGIDPSDPKAGAVGPVGADLNYPRPACFPYGAADGPRRLLFAGGPGLRLGGTPQDIAFANYRTPHKGGTDALETLDEVVLNGAFAFIMTTSGAISIVNIDPELRTTQQRYRQVPGGELLSSRVAEEPRPLTHSLRDGNVVTYTTALGPTNGPPRLATEPTVPVDGPRLMPFPTDETRFDARIVQTGSVTLRDAFVYFPNRATVNAQSWLIAWESDLTGTRITGDIVTPQAEAEPAPMITTITDNGAGFCGTGVDGDVLTLTGCDSDGQCHPGDVCVHSPRVPPSVDGRVIPGLCLHQNEVTGKRERCEPMMATFRRYEIVRNTPSVAVLVPKRVEVPRPVFTLADGRRAACNPGAAQPNPHSCQPEMSTVHGAFKCLEVTARPDGSALGKPDLTASPPVLGDLSYRCFQPCDSDAACGQGRVCLAYPGMPADSPRVCAEAAPLDKWCGFEQLVSYRLGAGNAFVVAGSSSGRTERVRTQAGPAGPECVPDFTSSPTLVARIPVNLPECSPDSGPATDDGKLKWNTAFLARDVGPAPNPCYILTLDKVRTTGDQCHDMNARCEVSVLFQNNELRLVMTDLQKPFSSTTQIRFDVNGGVAPQVVAPTLDAVAGLPARLLVGPVPMPQQTLDGIAATCQGMPGTADMPGPCAVGRGSDMPYMYVVDQRQVSGGKAGVRGQILRVTPRISETTSPVPGVESFANGGRYFPIQ